MRVGRGVIDRDGLLEALRAFLPNQRWFSGDDASRVALAELELLDGPWPALVRVEVDVAGPSPRSERYHVLVGVRPAGEVAPFLEGHAAQAMGELDTEGGPAYGYDALVDPELCLRVLRHVAPE